MQAADAFWHLTNFCAPAVIVGGLAAAATRLIWRRELGSRGGGLRLWAWASGACALALVLGLVVFERDGRMATYAAMVLFCALALWWAGFRAGKARPS